MLNDSQYSSSLRIPREIFKKGSQFHHTYNLGNIKERKKSIKKSSSCKINLKKKGRMKKFLENSSKKKKKYSFKITNNTTTETPRNPYPSYYLNNSFLNSKGKSSISNRNERFSTVQKRSSLETNLRNPSLGIFKDLRSKRELKIKKEVKKIKESLKVQIAGRELDPQILKGLRMKVKPKIVEKLNRSCNIKFPFKKKKSRRKLVNLKLKTEESNISYSPEMFKRAWYKSVEVVKNLNPEYKISKNVPMFKQGMDLNNKTRKKSPGKFSKFLKQPSSEKQELDSFLLKISKNNRGKIERVRKKSKFKFKSARRFINAANLFMDMKRIHNRSHSPKHEVVIYEQLPGSNKLQRIKIINDKIDEKTLEESENTINLHQKEKTYLQQLVYGAASKLHTKENVYNICLELSKSIFHLYVFLGSNYNKLSKFLQSSIKISTKNPVIMQEILLGIFIFLNIF